MNSRLISLSILGSFLICQNGFAGNENELYTFAKKIAPASWNGLSLDDRGIKLEESKAELAKICEKKSDKYLSRITTIEALFPQELTNQNPQIIRTYTNNKGPTILKTRLQGVLSKDHFPQNEETKTEISLVIKELERSLINLAKKKKKIEDYLNAFSSPKTQDLLTEALSKSPPKITDEQYNKMLKHFGKYASFFERDKPEKAFRHAESKEIFFKALATSLEKTPLYDENGAIEKSEKNTVPEMRKSLKAQCNEEISCMKEGLFKKANVSYEERLRDLNPATKQIVIGLVTDLISSLSTYSFKKINPEQIACEPFLPTDFITAKEELVAAFRAEQEKWELRKTQLDTPRAKLAMLAKKQPSSPPSSPQESPRLLSGTSNTAK